jgi:hypothetical protein
LENPLIKDLKVLFRYSGMVDQLRDSALLMYQRQHKVEPSRATLRDMVEQYGKLRDDLSKVVADEVAAEIVEYTKPLDPDNATADSIFMQAASLARIADLAHQTPKFMFSEKMASHAVEEFEQKSEKKSEPDRPGTYV